MNWNSYDERLKKLWNLVAYSYSDTISYETSERYTEEAMDLMEKLTLELQEKRLKEDKTIKF